MVRQVLRFVYLSVAGNFKAPSSRTHFLNGHFVTPDQISIERQQEIFFNQLVRLSLKSKLINPTEALSKIDQAIEPLICLTFDDGYEDVFSVIVPVLRKLNLKAIFFINPDFIGLDEIVTSKILKENYATTFDKKFMTKEQLDYIVQEGHLIGSHTLTHKRLTGEDEAFLAHEIIDSKTKIENLTGVSCNCFAYPFGGKNDISDKALSIAQTCYPYIFSSINTDDLLSFDGRVINRRHFEGNWPVNHIHYFLSRRE